VHTAGFRTRHRFHLHLFGDVEGSNTYLVVPGEPGHLTSVSVEFLRRMDSKGRQVNELLGGAFVNVPANPEARVLASKAGRRTSGAEAAMLDAIHDAACPSGRLLSWLG
jgi:hypothetical protein